MSATSYQVLNQKVISIKRQRQFIHRIKGETTRALKEDKGKVGPLVEADLEEQILSLEAIDKNLAFLENLATFLMP